MRSRTCPTRPSTDAPGTRSRSTVRQQAEDVDWIAPVDEDFAAMTDEAILGPGREYLGDRYPVCLGSHAATFPPNVQGTFAQWIQGWA